MAECELAEQRELRMRIEAMRNGDVNGPSGLLCTLRPIVRRFLLSKFGRAGEPLPWTDDIEQETLLRVHLHFHACRATSVAGVVAWVLVIARSAALDALRDELPRMRELGGSAIEQIADPDAETDAHEPSEVAVQLVQAQSLLSPRDAELLWHRIVANRSWSEVGSELGISWTAARRRFQRAQQFLRAVIDA